MAKGWKCARCSTENSESAVICSNCGSLRGSLVLLGSASPPAAWSGPSPASPGSSAVPPGPSPAWPGQAPAPPPGPTADTPPNPFEAFDQGAATSTPLWRRIPTGWIIVAVLVLVGTVAGAIVNASRSPSGEINKGGDLAAIDLRVGDCFSLKDSSADEIDDVTAVTCTEPHEYEMFFVGSMPDGQYPSQEELDAYVDANCKPAFYAYVGKLYAASDLDIFTLFPSNEGWGDGDHEVSCAAYHPRVPTLRNSVKGSNQ
jgi:hypothetical protein